MVNRNRNFTGAIIAMIIAMIVGIFHAQPAQAGTVSFGWVKSMGGVNEDFGFDIHVDEFGYVYNTGTSEGAIFINKYNNSGNIVWSQSLAGNGYGFSIQVNGIGEVFVTGPFQGTHDFDPGPGVYNLTSSGANDVFILKLDGNGDFVWAKQIGGTSVDEGYGVAIDENGNVYVSGLFSGTVDFDPGSGTFTLTSVGVNDAFVWKLDADGNFLWAKSMGGASGAGAYTIALDSTGNILTTGGFAGTVDFDPGLDEYNLTGSGSYDGFISKLDGDGNFVWAQKIEGSGDVNTGIEIAIDDNDNVYATGYFADSAQFGDAVNGINVVGAGGDDVFITKLNFNGEFVWAKALGGGSRDEGWGIAVDGSGHVFTTGYFTDTADFDPGVGISNLTSANGSQDIFISKLDNAGNFLWAKNLSGSGLNDNGEAIAVDDSGNVYLTGVFEETVDFDPGAGVYNLTSAGEVDVFVSKFAFIPQIHYVKWDATGANNGSSWINAYTDLQSALFAASSGDEIWIAQGIYKPTTGMDRTISFNLVNGVSIYGGFVGTETLLAQRDFQINTTILSGDIGVIADNSDNSYHVVVGSNMDNTALLDGFTITAGNADGDDPNNRGGGIYNNAGSPTLTNVIFYANFAIDRGGGMHNVNSHNPILTNVTFDSNSVNDYGGGGVSNDNSSPSLSNTTFINNFASEGGGMYNVNNSNPSLTQATFRDNVASSGGAIYDDASSPTLIDVILIGNSADQGGGGMYSVNPSNPSLTDVYFINNTATYTGGGMLNADGSSPNLTNVVFEDNSASIGGGMFNHTDSYSILNNVSFKSNSAIDEGGGVYNQSSDQNLINVTFDGNLGQKGGGMYNYLSNITLTNVTLVDNLATSRGGALYNWGSSPVLTNATFSGNMAEYYGGALFNDNNSNPVIVNSILYNDSGGEIYDYFGSSTVTYSVVQGGYLGVGNIDDAPLLGSLQDNGGFTQTMALQAGSPAIDAGDDANCPATDQRGVTRPQGSHCDIGAYEYQPPPAGKPSIPTLQSPANNALLTDYTPLLNWSDSKPWFHHYQLQIATDSSFTSPLVDVDDLIVSEFTVGSELPHNTKLYWRVRSFNSANETKGWSAVRYFRTKVDAPALVSPNNSFEPLTLRPTFDWDAPSGPAAITGYTIQISKNNTFTQIVHTGNPTTSNYTPTADLVKNTLLYWRVQAKGANGPSAWSEVRSFTSANSTAAPVLVSPANNTLNKDFAPLLKWKAVTLPTGTDFLHYQLQVDDNSDFSSLVMEEFITGQMTVQFQTINPLASNTKFYWRVRAVNDDNEVSNWSVVRYFRTVVDAPTLVSPNDGFEPLTLRPAFDWDVPSGPATITGYTIQIAKDSLFKQIVHTGNPTTSSYTPTADLVKNTLLYWRVQAKGANGPSAWSEVRSFTSANSTAAPVLVSPANNALITHNLPLLTWKAVTLPNGADFLHYQVQVDDTADFSSPVLDDTSITARLTVQLQVGPLASNTKFYWRVRAVNDDNEVSNWSVVRYFRTVVDAPVLLTPADLSTVAGDLTPTFDWSDATGPGAVTGYTIQVSTSSTFSSLLVNATTVNSTYTPVKNLPTGKTLYWRVRINGANGPSAWSIFSFSITP